LEAFEADDVYAHFVGIQSHSPFQPDEPDKLAIDANSFSCPSCYTEDLINLFNVARRVDAGLREFFDEVKGLSVANQRDYVFFLFGDHAPPVRKDVFSDAELASRSPEVLMAEDNLVP